MRDFTAAEKRHGRMPVLKVRKAALIQDIALDVVACPSGRNEMAVYGNCVCPRRNHKRIPHVGRGVDGSRAIDDGYDVRLGLSLGGIDTAIQECARLLR